MTAKTIVSSERPEVLAAKVKEELAPTEPFTLRRQIMAWPGNAAAQLAPTGAFKRPAWPLSLGESPVGNAAARRPMTALRLLVPAAVVAGSFAVAGAATAATPAAPGAGCIDPATTPTTVAPATTVAAAPTTLAAGAVPFTSPEGDYIVTFPGTPTLQTVPGTGAETTAWGYIAGPAGYVVTRSTLAEGQVVDLQGGCEGAIATMGATLISSAPIVVDGHQGIELVADVDGAGVVQRLIDTGTAMYQLLVTAPGALSADDPIVTAFFGSFHLTAAEASATTAPALPTVAVPTVAVPTVAVPTVAVPTVAVPTVAVPTVAVPTVAVPTVAGTTVAAPAGWTHYTSPTDGFSVAFPTEPTTSSNQAPTADGDQIAVNVTEAAAGERKYAVNYIQLPAGVTFDAEAGRDGSLGDFSATLVSSTPIELAGRAGLEFVGSFLQNGEPATMVSRIYSDGTNVHQLIALSFGAVDAADPEIAGFFGSFTFTGATPSLRSPATQAAAGRSLAGARSLASEHTVQ